MRSVTRCTISYPPSRETAGSLSTTSQQRDNYSFTGWICETAESVQLTHATCTDTQWRPWCVDSGRGVLDHRSVLNVARGLVIYFDGNEVHAVDVETLEDRTLFQIPADREAYGQNCCTPDGRWFVYIHVPRGSIWGQPCQGAAVVAYEFDTGQQHTLCRIDSAVFHVTAYDNEHFVVTHPAEGPGMMLTDMTSGRCDMLRDAVVHCPCTQRGIAYEVPKARRLGLMDPLSRRSFEFPMPEQFQYIHTGWDPEGRIFVYENSTDWDRFDVHDMYVLVRLDHRRQDPRVVAVDRFVADVCRWPESPFPPARSPATAAGFSSRAAIARVKRATSSCSISRIWPTRRGSAPNY